MGLVREIFAGNVAGVAPIRHFADGVDAEERDGRQVRVAAKFLVRDQPFARDDQCFRGAGELEVGDGSAADPAVAVNIHFVDVDGGDVRVEGRQGTTLRSELKLKPWLRKSLVKKNTLKIALHWSYPP